jgi:RNA polymerase sigma-70 factor, ECF subfamily
MIAAFQESVGFRGDSEVTTWLYRISFNAALDRIRRRAARPITAFQDEEAAGAVGASGQSLGDPSASSDTTVDVQAALRRLVPEQQAALVLVDMLGHPVVDAAGGSRRRAMNGKEPRSSRTGAAPGEARASAGP